MFLRSGLTSVTEAVRRHAALELVPDLAIWAQRASSLAVPRKGDQGKLDPAICALIGLMWRTKLRTGTIMLGNLETGRLPREVRSEIQA